MRTLVALLATLLTITAASAKDQGEIMDNSKQTLCLGRFLVEVPRDVQKIADASEYRWHKITVTGGTSHEGFERIIAERERQLKETKHNKDVSLLKEVYWGGDRSTAVLVFWKTPASRYIYETEAYKSLNSKAFLMKGNTEVSKFSIAKEMIGHSFSELQVRQNRTIPNSPGFCIDGGFFAGEPAIPHYERAFLHLRLKDHPDVRFEIFTDMNGEKLGESLLARIDRKPIPEIYREVAKQIKHIRRGEHDVGSIKGEETLKAYPTDEGYLTHTFRWESRGEARSLYAPTIVVKMESGQTPDFSAMPPSVTDKQAVEIFDAVVNSIRIRPVGDSGNTATVDPSIATPGSPRR